MERKEGWAVHWALLSRTMQPVTRAQNILMLCIFARAKPSTREYAAGISLTPNLNL